MTINELKTRLCFNSKAELDKYIADLFGFKTVGAYQNSTAKKRYENGLLKFYEKFNNKELEN